MAVRLIDALRTESEGLDGASGGHALLDVAVDLGVGRHLLLVGAPGPAQVPAGADGHDGNAGDEGQPENGRRPEQGGDGQNGGDAGHQQLRESGP